VAFAPTFLQKKLQSQTLTKEKLHKALSDEKRRAYNTDKINTWFSCHGKTGQTLTVVDDIFDDSLVETVFVGIPVPLRPLEIFEVKFAVFVTFSIVWLKPIDRV
jgi:hypothetical protein